MAKKEEEKQELFETVKKGYDKPAVEKYISDMTAKYESEIAELKKSLEEISAKERSLSEELSEVQNKKAQVVSVLINAEATANDIIEKAKQKAEDECVILDAEIEKRKRLVVDTNEQLRHLRIEMNSAIDEFCGKVKENAEKAKKEFAESMIKITGEEL